MKRLLTIGIILIILWSCKSPNKATSSENLSHTSPGKVDINEQKTEAEPRLRSFREPGRSNFEGEPIRQELDIPIATFEKIPDTLNKLAIARYKSYEEFFPRLIADNFKAGKSTILIDYPAKLIFSFEVFEDIYAQKPYVKRDVTVRRSGNGELSAE
jgi:hypothetical protein